MTDTAMWKLIDWLYEVKRRESNWTKAKGRKVAETVKNELWKARSDRHECWKQNEGTGGSQCRISFHRHEGWNEWRQGNRGYFNCTPMKGNQSISLHLISLNWLRLYWIDLYYNSKHSANYFGFNGLSGLKGQSRL